MTISAPVFNKQIPERAKKLFSPVVRSVNGRPLKWRLTDGINPSIMTSHPSFLRKEGENFYLKQQLKYIVGFVLQVQTVHQIKCLFYTPCGFKDMVCRLNAVLT